MTRQGAIYRPDWPETAVLYPGYNSPMPAIGDTVIVLNLHTCTARHGTVIRLLPRTNEYEVRIEPDQAIPVALSG